MDAPSRTTDGVRALLRVARGEDRFGERRGLGISSIQFKVTPAEGTYILILENSFHGRGGPPRHFHHDQEKWFYVTEGEFVFEVGDRSFRLGPGDSLLAPRKVPHVWACAGEGTGRILITFTPAGRMEGFFREVTRSNAMPRQEAELWRKHGMEVVGPPLSV